jgi:hypothetical protein
MKFEHVTRKIERTPEEQARLDAIRAKFDSERPAPEDLLAAGWEIVGPVDPEVEDAIRTMRAVVNRPGVTDDEREDALQALADILGRRRMTLVPPEPAPSPESNGAANPTAVMEDREGKRGQERMALG